ncbi:methyl-accepting chemotaxis protein [Acetobacterium sp.]|uniref:methyl-accepting chemotaxis protein n=1 Tax=Acetobacterium sp. TaxID=1872094 RepID=UPI00271BE2D6|nr:methyl-accepting chemotaxis protein [Acetobacterium sp.]MDO9491912.1 methyl-accepting chemotaxis protein [Acetobacterium sp.]
MLRYFDNVKMRTKLIIFFILTGLIPIAIISGLSYNQARNSLVEMKLQEMELYSKVTQNRFATELSDKEFYTSNILSDLAIVENLITQYQPTGGKGEQWDASYARVETGLTAQQAANHIESIYITDAAGNCIYASGQFKATMEGTNLATRDYFKASIQGQSSTTPVQYSDIIKKYYVTISAPFYSSQNGTIIGTVNSLILMDSIEAILNEGISDIGATGDIYLVDQAGLLNTNPSLSEATDATAFSTTITTAAVEQLKPNFDSDNNSFMFSGIYQDYRGEQVLGTASFVNIGATKLGMIIKVDEAEALAPVKSLQLMVVLVLILAIAASVIIVSILSKRITKPLETVSTLMDEAGQGNLAVRGEFNSRDEIGKLCSDFNRLVEKTGSSIKEIIQATEVLNESADAMDRVASSIAVGSEETSAKINVVSSAVEEISASMTQSNATLLTTADNTNQIASAIEEISSTTRNLAAASEETALSVNQTILLMGQIFASIREVSTSAENVNSEVNTVVDAVKEVNLSVNEISKSCEKSLEITQVADSEAKNTAEIIRTLNLSSKKINKIIKIIDDIADQTNMLALNAAIEAAGAGEAGKGFAVVANEVKELAKQTSEATDEIADQIEGMQENMEQAVSAVTRINHVVDEVMTITTLIATAVTEQSASTQGISEAAIRASMRLDRITEEIKEIDQKAGEVKRGAEESGLAVSEIAKSTAELARAADDAAVNTERTSVSMTQLSRATEETVKGAVEISRSIQEINQASEEITEGASKTSIAANRLVDLSLKLGESVQQFKF